VVEKGKVERFLTISDDVDAECLVDEKMRQRFPDAGLVFR
jgi:hypothetical protein